MFEAKRFKRIVVTAADHMERRAMGNSCLEFWMLPEGEQDRIDRMMVSAANEVLVNELMRMEEEHWLPASVVKDR